MSIDHEKDFEGFAHLLAQLLPEQPKKASHHTRNLVAALKADNPGARITPQMYMTRAGETAAIDAQRLRRLADQADRISVALLAHDLPTAIRLVGETAPDVNAYPRMVAKRERRVRPVREDRPAVPRRDLP